MHALDQGWQLLQVNPCQGKAENSQPSPNIPEGKLSDSVWRLRSRLKNYKPIWF